MIENNTLTIRYDNIVLRRKGQRGEQLTLHSRDNMK